MNEQIRKLEHQAAKARVLYHQKKITRQQAYDDISPYINCVNKKSKEIAKKYNQNPKLTNFQAYIR